jgi:putative hydrolase of the HAD superfamily
MLTTIIFDMDDTLYDEIDYCKSGFKAAADFIAQNKADSVKVSPERIYEVLWDEFTSGNTTRTFNAALEKFDVPFDRDFIARLVEIYRNHYPNISLPSRTEQVLEELRKKYTLALLTDGFLPAQKYKVESLGLGKFFQEIIYTEQLGREYWKPSTPGFEILLKNSNTPPEQSAYIADNEEKDFIAPAKLGMKTIQIKRKNRIRKQSDPANQVKAQHQIKKLTELTLLLESI